MPRGPVLLQRVASSSAAVQTENSEDVLWDWLTASTTMTTSTATQTLHHFHCDVDDNPDVRPDTFQQWRGIQGKYLLGLHKLQHSIQRTLEQIRDPRRPLPARTPTTAHDQPTKRTKITTDDMDLHCAELLHGDGSRQCPSLPSLSERRTVQLRPLKRRRKPAHRRRKKG